MSQEQYITSTGQVGVIEQRSHNRVSLTAESPVTNVIDLQQQVDSVFSQCPSQGGRAMWKGITTGIVLAQLTTRPDISESLEVAIPLSIIDLGDQYFTIFGKNDDARISAFSSTEHSSIQERHKKRKPQKAIDLISRHIREYTFYRDIPSNLEGQFAQSWERFGWTEDQVKNYAQLLSDQQQMIPSDRTLWNIGLSDKNGLLKAAATAELFSLKQLNGRPLHFIELTEWASNKSGEGLMQAAAAHIVCQVLADRGNEDILLYAETNAANGAPSVGRHIGLDFLSSHPHNEKNPAGVLYANVPVADGRRDIKTQHRDFYWMGLSADARRKYYSPDDVKQILAIT